MPGSSRTSVGSTTIHPHCSASGTAASDPTPSSLAVPESATSSARHFVLANRLGLFDRVPRFFVPPPLPSLAGSSPPAHSLALLPVRASVFGTLPQFYAFLHARITSIMSRPDAAASPLLNDRAASAETYDGFRAGLGAGVEAYEATIEDATPEGVAALRAHLERVEVGRDAVPQSWDAQQSAPESSPLSYRLSSAHHTYSSLRRVSAKLCNSANPQHRSLAASLQELPTIHSDAVRLANEPIFEPVAGERKVPWLEVHPLVTPGGNMKGPSSFNLSFTRREVAEGFISPATPLVSSAAFNHAFRQAVNVKAEYVEFLRRTEKINAALARIVVTLCEAVLPADVREALLIRHHLLGTMLDGPGNFYTQHRQLNSTPYPPSRNVDDPPANAAASTSRNSPLFRRPSSSPEPAGCSISSVGFRHAARAAVAEPRDIVLDLGARFGTLHADGKDDEASWSVLVPLGVLPPGSHGGTFHDPRTGSYMEWDVSDPGFYLFRGVDPHVGTPATLPSTYAPHPQGWTYSRSIVVNYPSRAAASPDEPLALDVEQALSSRQLFHGLTGGMRFLGDLTGQAAAGGADVVHEMLVLSRARHSLSQDLFRRFRLDHYGSSTNAQDLATDDAATVAVQDEVDRILTEMAGLGRSWEAVVKYEAAMLRLAPTSPIIARLVARGNPLGHVVGEQSSLCGADTATRRRAIAKADELFHLAAASVVKVRNSVKAASTANGAAFLRSRGWRRRVVSTTPPDAIKLLHALDKIETWDDEAALARLCYVEPDKFRAKFEWFRDPAINPAPPVPPLAGHDSLFPLALLARRTTNAEEWTRYVDSHRSLAASDRVRDPLLATFSLPPPDLSDRLAINSTAHARFITPLAPPAASDTPIASTSAITLEDGIAFHRGPSTLAQTVAVAAEQRRHMLRSTAPPPVSHKRVRPRELQGDGTRTLSKRPRRSRALTDIISARLEGEMNAWHQQFPARPPSFAPPSLKQAHVRLAPSDELDPAPVSLAHFAELMPLPLGVLQTLVNQAFTHILYARDSNHQALPASLHAHALAALELDGIARVGTLLRGELGDALRAAARELQRADSGGEAGAAIRAHLTCVGGIQMEDGGRISVFASLADGSADCFALQQPTSAITLSDVDAFEPAALEVLLQLFLLSFFCPSSRKRPYPWVINEPISSGITNPAGLTTCAAAGAAAVASAVSQTFLASLFRAHFRSSTVFLLPGVRGILQQPQILLDPLNGHKRSSHIPHAHYPRWEEAVGDALSALEAAGALESRGAPHAKGKKTFERRVYELGAKPAGEQAAIATMMHQFLNLVLVVAADDVLGLPLAPHRQAVKKQMALEPQLEKARRLKANDTKGENVASVYKLLRENPYKLHPVRERHPHRRHAPPFITSLGTPVARRAHFEHDVRVRLGLIGAVESVYTAFPPGGLGSVNLDSWLDSPTVRSAFTTHHLTLGQNLWGRINCYGSPARALKWDDARATLDKTMEAAWRKFDVASPPSFTAAVQIFAELRLPGCASKQGTSLSQVLLAGDLCKDGFIGTPSIADMARAVSTVAKGAIVGLAQLGFLRLSPSTTAEERRLAIERAFLRFYALLNDSVPEDIKLALRQLDLDLSCPFFVENLLCKLTRSDWGERKWVSGNLGWMDINSPTSPWRVIVDELAAAQPVHLPAVANPTRARPRPGQGKGKRKRRPARRPSPSDDNSEDDEVNRNEEEDEEDEDDEEDE
ncbi:uncharacterized protein JCM10292_004234 [Rhodotorula paludigena]|uniref:uncharacterized protein n=1 Tax=Rhodotorula paludigena TaxID=86838 RepID=UPI0031769BD0